jgi:autotransporter-associated beta strand protein
MRCFLTLLLFLAVSASAQIGGSGWTPQTLNFKVQSPYNLPVTDRYWFTNNIYHCQVFSNDAPFSAGNTTLPRTEQRFNPDYSSGEIQYQSMEMMPSNENSYCVFQIHTGDAESPTYGSTTFMLFWFTNSGGSVRDYSGTTLATNLSNQWFQLNVDHNLVSHTIKVWINQKLVWNQQDNGASDFYMKDGVYEQSHNPTYQMDTYITNILMWTSPGSPVVPLKWTGQTNGVSVGAWDLKTTTNWVNSTNGAIESYQDGSPVTFDDSAAGATSVSLQSAFSPASVTVSNTVKNYTFAGSGSVGGSASLMKYGGGTLTLDTVNSFTGGVFIGGGTILAGTSTALGSTSGSTVITNGGTLDVNGNNLGTEPVFVSGWGVNSNGAIVSSSSSAQTHALQNMTLAGDTAFGGPGNWLTSGNPGRWDIRGTGTTLTMSGGRPFNLYKTGSNQVSFVSVAIDTNLANIDIQQGMLGFEAGATSMGNPADNLIVRAGATLEFYQSSAPSNSYTKQFILYGGGAAPCITNWSGGGSSTISGRMMLNGPCVIGVNGTSFTNNCVIAGTGGLIKGGTRPLVLGAVNTYSGNTTLNGGILLLKGNGSISSSANIFIAAGATLDASARSDATLTLTAAQIISGNGTLNGNVVVGDGAALAPGNPIGTLAIDGDLNLNGGSTTVMAVDKNATPSNSVAQVAGTLTCGGTLLITNLGSIPFASGDSFKLFNAAQYNGTFSHIMPASPVNNLAWDTDGLTNGVLKVVQATTKSPKFAGMTATGNRLVIFGAGGVPDWPYRIATSTNLALSPTNWTLFSTDMFDENGNFIFTNNLNPGFRQQFYRLEMY